MSLGGERPRPAAWLQYFYFHAINQICFPLSLILGSYAFLAAVPTTPPRLRSPTLAAKVTTSTCQGSKRTARTSRTCTCGPSAWWCPPRPSPRAADGAATDKQAADGDAHVDPRPVYERGEGSDSGRR